MTDDGGISQEFTKELTVLLNKHSIDARLGTPDFLLAVAVSETLRTMAETKDRMQGTDD